MPSERAGRGGVPHESQVESDAAASVASGSDREQELLNRIRELEEQNSLLRDKLDMIYSIIASDYEEDEDGDSDLAQIEN